MNSSIHVCTCMFTYGNTYTSICTSIRISTYMYRSIHVHVLIHVHLDGQPHVQVHMDRHVEMINKQTQQTNNQPQWLIKFIKPKHKGLRKH